MTTPDIEAVKRVLEHMKANHTGSVYVGAFHALATITALQTRVDEAEATIANVRERTEHWFQEAGKVAEIARDRDRQLATLRAAIAESLRRGDMYESSNAIQFIVEPLRNLDQPEGEDALNEEKLLAELALLYNHKDDDSRQFTRWQMAVAIRHGMSLASRGLVVRGEGV